MAVGLALRRTVLGGCAALAAPVAMGLALRRAVVVRYTALAAPAAVGLALRYAVLGTYTALAASAGMGMALRRAVVVGCAALAAPAGMGMALRCAVLGGRAILLGWVSLAGWCAVLILCGIGPGKLNITAHVHAIFEVCIEYLVDELSGLVYDRGFSGLGYLIRMKQHNSVRVKETFLLIWLAR